jgi:hypothetical protein
MASSGGGGRCRITLEQRIEDLAVRQVALLFYREARECEQGVGA